MNYQFLSNPNPKDSQEIFKSKKLVPFMNADMMRGPKTDADAFLVQSNIVNEYQLKQQFGSFTGEFTFE